MHDCCKCFTVFLNVAYKWRLSKNEILKAYVTSTIFAFICPRFLAIATLCITYCMQYKKWACYTAQFVSLKIFSRDEFYG